jgi:cyclohexanecarboxylate-CoA ligase
MIFASKEEIARFTDAGLWLPHTIYEMFLRQAAAMPEVTAVADPPNRKAITGHSPRQLNFRELQSAVGHFAGFLQSQGFVKDDILVVQMPNVWELLCLYLAAARLGLIISPVSLMFRQHELRTVFATTQAKAYIAMARVQTHDYSNLGADASDGMANAPPVRTYLWHAEDCVLPEDAISLNNALAAKSETALNISTEPSPYDIFSICWTSGTTGTPKAVPRSHSQWLGSGRVVRANMGMAGAERFLLAFPMINAASMGGTFGPWLLGGGSIHYHHPFELGVFLQQVAEEQITTTVLAPAILGRILNDAELSAKADFSSLRSLAGGAAPLSPFLTRGFAAQFGLPLMNVFGSNEGFSLACNAERVPDPDARAKYFELPLGMDWRAMSPAPLWLEIRLNDPITGEAIHELDRIGEARSRGGSVFPGYFEDSLDGTVDKTVDKSVFDADGFFATGDLFKYVQDGQGNVFMQFEGRAKDLIIRGGMNISPEELDNLLADHPDVLEAAVAGYNDLEMGERVCACIVPKPGLSIGLDQITKFLRQKQIAAYKLPEKLLIISELPRNAVGKVQRFKLTEALNQNS